MHKGWSQHLHMGTERMKKSQQQRKQKRVNMERNKVATNGPENSTIWSRSCKQKEYKNLINLYFCTRFGTFNLQFVTIAIKERSAMQGWESYLHTISNSIVDTIVPSKTIRKEKVNKIRTTRKGKV